MTKKAHILVVGNEKGGSGKSTVAMHVAIGLLRLGYNVGTIDLDSHQATFTNYMKNRWQSMQTLDATLPCPEHVHIDRAEGRDVYQNRERETSYVDEVVRELGAKNDFIVIDTPGSDRFLSIVGHSYADTLLTPLNDSFVDLDLLAKIDPETLAVIKPSVYTEMVWDLRKKKKAETGQPMQWFIMRNRLGTIDNQNKRNMHDVIDNLQYQLGFRIAPGLAERVIYRELFLKGMTLLDLREGDKHTLSLSNINARQEIRSLVRRLLPQKDVSTLSLLKTY